LRGAPSLGASAALPERFAGMSEMVWIDFEKWGRFDDDFEE
jgi:hypothetical protein